MEQGKQEDRRKQLNDQAAQASALLAARANERRGSAEPRGADKVADAELQQAYPKGLVEYIKQNAVYIAGVVVVVVIVAALIVIMGAFMTGCSPEPTAEDAAYSSPYDWTKLEQSGDRLQYVVDGQVKSRIGVDVSENQHDIDWNAVAADGIDFAIVRVGYCGATEGDLYLDERYWDNLDGARAAGLACGVYFFSQAQTIDETVEEADFVLEYLNGTSLEYPIVFDSEEVVLNLEQSRTAGLTNDQMTSIAQAFCNRVEQAGYDAMVYGNGADMARYNYGGIEAFPVWWAEYDVAAPHHDLDIAMWQYTNGGEVAGIPTAVDLSIDLSNALN